MFLVKTLLKPSRIHGIGVFADQDIKKGTLVWRFDPQFDIIFDSKQMALMPEAKKNFIMGYGYLSKETNKYILSIDNARFLNHSASNNIDGIDIPGEPEGGDIANRDIKMREELTVDYRTFDANDQNSEANYLG